MKDWNATAPTDWRVDWISKGQGLKSAERNGQAAARQKAVSAVRQVYLGVDVPLLLTVITLAIFGLLMVFSASYDYSLRNYGSPTYMFGRQMLWMGIGILAVIFLTWMDYHNWRKLVVPAMAGTIFLLVAVLVSNVVVNNAVRTLFAGSVQPSELAKLVTVLYVGVWVFSKRDNLHNIWFGLIPLGAILGVVGGLIFVQPDLSAVITIFFLGGVLFFLAGGELRQMLLLGVLAILVGWVVVQLNLTGSERVSQFQAGLQDPTNASYHVKRSIEAFVKGKVLGVGIGKSETKLTGLPVPSTDSVFAVVGEETGLVGAALLVMLYVLLLWRGLTIAMRAPDELGRLLAAGLSIWISTEAFVNMAVMLNLLPFAGNALPFISSGGSNLVVTFSAIGILLNISRASVRKPAEEGRSIRAVIDLRRWDRRRRVPRALRSTDSSG